MNRALMPHKLKGHFTDVSNYFKLHKYNLDSYKPNVKVNIENSRFIIKTLEDGSEITKVLKLRYEVLYKEFLGIDTSKKPNTLDIDEFDILFDHLVIIDKKTDNIIGTYRLNCTKFNKILYAAKELNMSSIDALPGYKVEMGRACVHPDFRNGVTIAALWKGLGDYVRQTGARYMFGCASIKTDDPYKIVKIHSWLSQYHSEEHKTVLPTKEFENELLTWALKRDVVELNELSSDDIASEIPPLLMTYLKSGGVICGQPSHDKYFKIFNYLTLVDKENMVESFHRKFFE